MIELSTHIEYLLLSQSWVSVPQLGTFTRRDMSSRRIDEEGIFLPPYRTASFQWNSQEAGEDFILSLSKLHGLSRHEARTVCMEQVDELQQALSEEGRPSEQDKGFGMANVAERLRMNYGETYGLTVESEYKKGTVVEVRFPKTIESL